MDLIQAAILGFVQGITEYVPVSSSAHLVLVPEFLGWNLPKNQVFVFNILVQLGTLLGVLIYFSKDLVKIATSMISGLTSRKPLKSPEARLGWLIGLATVPAGMAGIFLKSYVEPLFHSPRVAMGFLLGTAGILTLAEFLSRKNRTRIRLLDAVFIGLAQVLALLPGMSRSGSTISAGVILGLSKESAARFSFLMSIPIMLGASLVASQDLWEHQDLFQQMFYPLLTGWVVAACTGYLTIRWFLEFLKTQSLLWFAAYCAFVGSAGLILA